MTHKVDVRDIARSVEKKTFREDFLDRLAVFPIEAPALRERVDEFPMLVWGFVQDFSQSMGKTIGSIPVESMEPLKSDDWPGNVRELGNVIECAMI